MTEKKVRLSKAGAAVVAPFAHMQPNACTHTLKNHLWTHPQEMDLSSGGAEFAAQAHTRIHTHTERLHPHWLTSLHPTAGVSEGSAAVLCSRGLETLEWAIFFPLSTSIFGLDIEGPQPPSFSTVFQNTGSQCALFVWHSVPSLQIKTAGL